MNNWFRSWHGAPTDSKWLVIGRKAGVAPGVVAAVVWALFDHASQTEDRGSVIGFDVETYSAFSGFDEEQIQAVIDGAADPRDNVLKNAPHTAEDIAADDWSHPYTRQQAAFPLPFVRANKVWPAVARIDNPYGDRNLICACPPIEAFAEQQLEAS